MILAIATLLCAQAGPAADRAVLLEGLESVESVGVPGPVVVYGPEAFAVLTSAGGEAVVGAGRYGEGRVVAFGHGGYLGEGPPDSGRARLLRNAISWAAGENSKPRVASLRQGRPFPRADVLTWPGGRLSEMEQRSLREFVSDGGGLVLGQCPWGWQQLNPGARLREDAPANRVLAPMGLALGPTTLSGPFRIADSRPDRAHAGEALAELIKSGKSERLLLLERAVAAVPDGAGDFLARLETWIAVSDAFEPPSEARPLRGKDAASRLAVAWWSRQWEETPPAEVVAAPGSDLFPGAVPADAPRLKKTIVLEGARPGWTSTGLYAPAGELLSARQKRGSTRGWYVRIGAHSDSIAHKPAWKRWPQVLRRFALDGAATLLASPFGGLVYLEAGKGAGPLTLELEGVVEAPYYDLSDPTADERWASVREHPAPWAEIAGRNLILTVPSEAVRGLEDPARLARYWDRVVAAHYRLAARPLPARPERFVADVQISAGYMHSGYPIMTHLDVTRPSKGRPQGISLDVERLEESGSWGHFHELGHNCQRGAWTFGGTGEVTCNLFSLHAMGEVVGLVPWDVRWLVNQKPKAQPYLSGGEGFAKWKRDPGLALLMYAQLQREFGWELYQTVFAEYEAEGQGAWPRGDAAKRDQWMLRLSRASGRDLGPFFERWGVPIGEAARAEVATLEPWLPDFDEL